MRKKQPSYNHLWHTLSPEATREVLTSTEQGLSRQEAEHRLKQYGFNKLTAAASRGPLKRFFSQFHNVLIYVLLIAVGVTAAIEHWVDSGVMVGVVVINALIGFIQEGKAEKALDAIRNMLTLQAMVQRDGKRFVMPAEQLVPDDIVTIESSDKVPADLRLLQVKNLRADESMLTGESLPVEKNTGVVGVNTALGDRFCLAYSGTLSRLVKRTLVYRLG
jgi:magnesium-transporting ATPase (P-type)